MQTYFETKVILQTRSYYPTSLDIMRPVVWVAMPVDQMRGPAPKSWPEGQALG